MRDSEYTRYTAFDPERLDTFVAREANITRSRAQKLIQEGHVLANGAPQRSGYMLRAHESVSVCIPEAEPPETAPEDIPVSIIYEDADIAVIDKPRGMVVHPAPGNYSGTLVNALLYHLGGLSGIGGEQRPGIVHRLDKDTSGLLVVAKHDAAHNSIAGQLKERVCSRVYWALVWGCPKWDEHTVDAPIGRHRTDRKRMAVVPDGREAVTDFKTLERFERNALIEASLRTGRTHQIRVHLSSIGLPVAGDPLYGQNRSGFGDQQFLHAKRLRFTHPSTGEGMEFESSLPEYFESALRKLRKRT